jgi:hypothetical protein
MSAAVFAALGAAGGVLATAVASIVISFSQRRSALRIEHRSRAFERHLPKYERIFVTARSAQDALRDYVAIEKRVADRSDPFLLPLLANVEDWAHQFCHAVNWHHNSSMVYLDIKLEEKCLQARGLLLLWLSRQRVAYGDVAFLRNDGALSAVSLRDIRSLRPGDYQELRLERRIVVISDPGDHALSSKIDRALSSVIVELKAVMAY